MRCDERAFGRASAWRSINGRIAQVTAAESIAAASRANGTRVNSKTVIQE